MPVWQMVSRRNSEQRSETMTHAEDIKSALYEADNTLAG